MRRFVLLTLVLFVLGVRPFHAQSISFDTHADFYKYKTYKWVSIPGAEELDELTSGQLMGTIEVELAQKGLTKTDADTADLLIGYQIASGKGKPLKNLKVGTAYGSTGGTAETTGAIATIHSGELALDMYDAAEKQLVWRGVIGNSIEADAKPDKKQKHMSHAVEKLLKHYPPAKK